MITKEIKHSDFHGWYGRVTVVLEGSQYSRFVTEAGLLVGYGAYFNNEYQLAFLLANCPSTFEVPPEEIQFNHVMRELAKIRREHDKKGYAW